MTKTNLADLKVMDKYFSDGAILLSAGVEIVQYSNQLLVYHIETKND
jgi:hypothetical protein